MPNKPSAKTRAAAWPDLLRPMIVSEADHRMKKTLERVASLLQLQAADGAITRPDEALADAAARLRALAHWHAFLSHPRNRGRRALSLDSYLLAFAEHCGNAFVGHSRIVFLVNADPVKVPARIAGMLGQIVNELVISTLRHAVGATDIQVECGTDAGGRLVLQVTDDRTGCLNGYRLGAPGAFDMQIVTALAKQLGGKFTASKPGARICHRLTIPMPGGVPATSRKRAAVRRPGTLKPRANAS
jgi:two-component sensor histidine kinase